MSSRDRVNELTVNLRFLVEKDTSRAETTFLIDNWQLTINSDKIFYNEEFDPGSGWTLATGLTHASRGAAWTKLALFDGDRRTGE